MKVNDIVSLAFSFVGEKEISSALASGETDFSSRDQEKVDEMTRCFNLVNQEIASDYLPYLIKEEVENVSVLPFSDLSKTVINIYEVKNRFGFNVKFKVFDSFVQFCGKAKWVVYSYLPDEAALSDEVTCYAGLTERVLAYGMASEYLMIMGLSSDAEIWENRFKDSLFVLSRKRGEHTLPRRRWL